MPSSFKTHRRHIDVFVRGSEWERLLSIIHSHIKVLAYQYPFEGQVLHSQLLCRDCMLHPEVPADPKVKSRRIDPCAFWLDPSATSYVCTRPLGKPQAASFLTRGDTAPHVADKASWVDGSFCYVVLAVTMNFAGVQCTACDGKFSLFRRKVLSLCCSYSFSHVVVAPLSAVRRCFLWQVLTQAP